MEVVVEKQAYTPVVMVMIAVLAVIELGVVAFAAAMIGDILKG